MEPIDQENRLFLNTFRELCLKFCNSANSQTNAKDGGDGMALPDALLRAADRLSSINERLGMVIESAKLAWWDHDLINGTVIRSRTWAEMLGFTQEEIGSGLFEWKNRIHPDDAPLVEQICRRHESGNIPYFEVEHRMKHKNGEWIWIQNWGKIVERDREGRPLRALGFHLDITRRKQAELDREELILKLEKTLNELKTLRGIIPICSCCKNIRDDQGSWHQIESYIREHSEAEFSHGMCPKCVKKFYKNPNNGSS